MFLIMYFTETVTSFAVLGETGINNRMLSYDNGSSITGHRRKVFVHPQQ